MENINLSMFSPKKAELITLADKYKDLKIDWVKDTKWFKLVHDAQMELKNARVWIQKTRLEYTRQFDEAKKQAMDLERELLWIITPIEESLKEQKEKIEAEKEKLKEEERQKKQKLLQDRIDKLATVGYVHPNVIILQDMDEFFFNDLFENQKVIFEIAQQKIKEEEEKRLQEQEEQDKLFKKNAVRSRILQTQDLLELDIIADYIESNKLDLSEFSSDLSAKKDLILSKQKIEEDQRKIKEEQDRLAKLEQDRLREVELEKARKEWEEREKKNAEIKAQQDAILKKQQEEKEQAELERKRKYQNFLKENEGKYDWFFDKDWKRILYKIVAEFKL